MDPRIRGDDGMDPRIRGMTEWIPAFAGMTEWIPAFAGMTEPKTQHDIMRRPLPYTCTGRSYSVECRTSRNLSMVVS
jgi:hypothetical protein